MRSRTAGDREKRTNAGVCFAVFGEERGPRVLRERGVKHPVCCRAARVDDPFGDPLIIEMGDLSRRMKSSNGVGPRRPAFNEF